MSQARIVVWKDSCTQPGWKRQDDDHSVSIITSIGWVVRDTKRELTMTTSISAYGNVVDAITIPKACIVRQTRLKYKVIKK